MTAPDTRTRAAVWDREGGCCAACGKVLTPGSWYSIQHRKARGVGGGNELTNLILLCGSATSDDCHRLCENRDQVMHERGLWVNSWEDPAAVPVQLYGPGGQWRTRWLGPAGEYLTELPAELAS